MNRDPKRGEGQASDEGSVFTRARARMVARDIASRGVSDPDVLRAMRTVPRERFIPSELAEFAYENHPLPIAEEQTISQPYIVALMAEAAEVGPRDRVLEVGAGSGYGAAVLSRIAAEVWTIERHRALADNARRMLEELGYHNAHVVWGDGTLGYPDAAPFDAIVVTAGAVQIPEALLEQLIDGGRRVIPVGPTSRQQRLLRIRRDGDTFNREDFGPVRFVSLVGDADEKRAFPKRQSTRE
ncbi:MAG: protein-L-isoaspartate(D-aspartate) O-methyltransferase [Acidimicrobiia bacterium]